MAIVFKIKLIKIIENCGLCFFETKPYHVLHSINQAFLSFYDILIINKNI